MRYRIRFPPEDATSREFDVDPAEGVLQPGERARIQIDLRATTRQVYDTFALVDVMDVGQGLLTIPICADCVVPAVTATTPRLDFAYCFRDYDYDRVR